MDLLIGYKDCTSAGSLRYEMRPDVMRYLRVKHFGTKVTENIVVL